MSKTAGGSSERTGCGEMEATSETYFCPQRQKFVFVKEEDKQEFSSLTSKYFSNCTMCF